DVRDRSDAELSGGSHIGQARSLWLIHTPRELGHAFGAIIASQWLGRGQRGRGGRLRMAKLHVVTDAGGNIPAGVRLRPNTEYRAEPRRERITGRLRTNEELANWITDAVIGDLRTLRLGILERAKNRTKDLGEANFLLLGACLMALE